MISQMEVECLALKDLTSPRKSFPAELEEEGGDSEHKENIWSSGRRRSTPLKLAESRKGVAADLADVTPIKHTPLAEPWTPTANLKMLISAASPDIRNREMRKVLFRPIENETDKPDSPESVGEDVEVDDSCQFDAVEEDDDAEKKPSRKSKSLGLLCQKFLALYPDYPPAHVPIWISLDEVATSLGVERRRIYDIVNVLESLTIVGRIAKNSYTWYGRLRLDARLEELQRQGRQQGYHLQMEQARGGRGAGPGQDDGGEEDTGPAAGNRKDKSLRIMSQKFVMLFLVSRTQTVTLEAAANVLIEEGQDSSSHSKYKTKVRRLYDIANVLTSLGLIKKVHVREERGRKPAFRWLGPVQFDPSRTSGTAGGQGPEATHTMAGPDPRKAKLARHASFHVTPPSASVQRQVSSAPSSPRRDLTAPTNQPLNYSTARSSGAVCRLQFGNHTGCPTLTLPQASAPPTLLAPALHPERLLALSPSPHCVAYLPSLSQPSVVMLYGAAEGHRSEPEEGRKRRRDVDEEEGVAKKRGTSGLKDSEENKSNRVPLRVSPPPTPDEGAPGPHVPSQPSHYLYVPNTGGLSGLNLLLPAGQPPSSTLALPYVLLPSAALSRYPPDSDARLSFGVPAAHFMVGAAPYGLVGAASDVHGSPVPPPGTPQQSRLNESPQSPSGPRQASAMATPEPSEVPASASKAFFQTPGALGGVASTAAPVTRKRGSAQRRLDIGPPPTGSTPTEKAAAAGRVF